MATYTHEFLYILFKHQIIALWCKRCLLWTYLSSKCPNMSTAMSIVNDIKGFLWFISVWMWTHLLGTVVMKSLWKCFGGMSIIHVLFDCSLPLPQHGHAQRAQLFYFSVFLERNSLHRIPEWGQCTSYQTRQFDSEGCFLCMCCAFECVLVFVNYESATMVCQTWLVPRAYGQADRKLVLGIDYTQVNLLWVIFWK